ncbi:MAG: hypothetical protein ACLR8P_11825 [Clostridium fessum]
MSVRRRIVLSDNVLAGRRHRGIPLCGRAPQPDDPRENAGLSVLTLTHMPEFQTSVVPIGDGVALSVKAVKN